MRIKKTLPIHALIVSALMLGGTPAYATESTSEDIPETAQIAETPKTVEENSSTPETNETELTPTEELVTETQTVPEPATEPTPELTPETTPDLSETHQEEVKIPELSQKLQKQTSNAPTVKGDFAYPLPLKKYAVSSYFGPRCLVTLNSGTFHNAIDLAAPEGTPTYAMRAGKVISITQAKGKEVGGEISIDHGTYKGKQLIITYIHSWEPGKYYKVGDKVKQGAVVAPVGNSGISTGPHVHLMVKYGGALIDPKAFFKQNGLDITAGAYYVVPQTATPKTCTVYNHGNIGLKTAPSYTSTLKKVIPNGTKFTITPGQPKEFHVPAKLQDGTTGWVRIENLSNAQRTTNPTLTNVTNSESGFTYTPHKSQQNLRDFPSNSISQAGIITTITFGEKVISTGRSIKGTNWEEYTYKGTKVWVDKTIFKIVNVAPTTTKTGTKGAKKLLTNGAAYTIPTTNKLALDNKKTNLPTSNVVTTTGKYYNSWTQITAKNINYWVPAANLQDYNKPTLKKGDIVVRDSSGKLWNYSNMVKTSTPRVLIGSGWGDMKDILITDFNADGVLDIVANNKNGKLYLYPGNKTGGFSATKTIGNSGWSNLELNVTKMKKADKYPTIITKDKNGKVNAYESTGKALKAARTILTGTKSFTSINFIYYDKDSNVDILLQDKAGKQLLYRTNGSTVINEKRATVGAGWSNLKTVTVSNSHSSNTSGIVATKTNGQLYYYTPSGNSSWGATKLIGGSGWKPYYIAKSSI